MGSEGIPINAEGRRRKGSLENSGWKSKKKQSAKASEKMQGIENCGKAKFL